MQWHETGTVAPRSLTAARLQLHYGALVLGSVAHSLLAHADDDSHSNLGWNQQHRSFCTHPLAADHGLSLHLDLPTFALVLRGETEELAALRLPGQTLASALEWVSSQLKPTLGSSSRISLREYPDFPASPIMGGEAFDQPDQVCVGELARWFGNASKLIEALHATHPAMIHARVWPHHLDLGAVLPVEGGSNRSIEIGLSPGDHHYDQPYFYCSPHPQPTDAKTLPPIAVGHWHAQDFVSVILTAQELLGRAMQADSAKRYLVEAVAACITILSRGSKP